MQQQEVLDEPLAPLPTISPLLDQGLIVAVALCGVVHYLPSVGYELLGGAFLERIVRVVQVLVLAFGLWRLLQHWRHATTGLLRLVVLGSLTAGGVFFWRIITDGGFYDSMGYESLGGFAWITLLIFLTIVKCQQKEAALFWQHLLPLVVVYGSYQLVVEFLLTEMAWETWWWLGQGHMVLLLVWMWSYRRLINKGASVPDLERRLLGAFTFALGLLWSARIWVIKVWWQTGLTNSPSWLQHGLWLLAWLFCLILGVALVLYYKKQNITAAKP